MLTCFFSSMWQSYEKRQKLYILKQLFFNANPKVMTDLG